VNDCGSSLIDSLRTNEPSLGKLSKAGKNTKLGQLVSSTLSKLGQSFNVKLIKPGQSFNFSLSKLGQTLNVRVFRFKSDISCEPEPLISGTIVLKVKSSSSIIDFVGNNGKTEKQDDLFDIPSNVGPIFRFLRLTNPISKLLSSI